VENNGRSVTAEGAAIQRALHQTLDAAPKILDDPVAPLLVDVASGSNQASIAGIESMTRPVKSPLRAVFITRSRSAEDCLAELQLFVIEVGAEGSLRWRALISKRKRCAELAPNWHRHFGQGTR
jgi:hypothetical protein